MRTPVAEAGARALSGVPTISTCRKIRKHTPRTSIHTRVHAEQKPRRLRHDCLAINTRQQRRPTAVRACAVSCVILRGDGFVPFLRWPCLPAAGSVPHTKFSFPPKARTATHSSHVELPLNRPHQGLGLLLCSSSLDGTKKNYHQA